MNKRGHLLTGMVMFLPLKAWLAANKRRTWQSQEQLANLVFIVGPDKNQLISY